MYYKDNIFDTDSYYIYDGQGYFLYTSDDVCINEVLFDKVPFSTIPFFKFGVYVVETVNKKSYLLDESLSKIIVEVDGKIQRESYTELENFHIFCALSKGSSSKLTLITPEGELIRNVHSIRDYTTDRWLCVKYNMTKGIFFRYNWINKKHEWFLQKPLTCEIINTFVMDQFFLCSNDPNRLMVNKIVSPERNIIVDVPTSNYHLHNVFLVLSPHGTGKREYMLYDRDMNLVADHAMSYRHNFMGQQSMRMLTLEDGRDIVFDRDGFVVEKEDNVKVQDYAKWSILTNRDTGKQSVMWQNGLIEAQEHDRVAVCPNGHELYIVSKDNGKFKIVDKDGRRLISDDPDMVRIYNTTTAAVIIIEYADGTFRRYDHNDHKFYEVKDVISAGNFRWRFLQVDGRKRISLSKPIVFA